MAALRPELRAAIERAINGLPANVALMHVLMQATSQGEAENALESAAAVVRDLGDYAAAARLQAALKLLRANPQAYGVVRSIVDGLDHDRAPGNADPLRYWADNFDAAARRNPEASVALYALGSPELLAAATEEIAERLSERGLLSPDTYCLDLGCGIGRVEVALARRLRRIVGVDISAEMVAEARRRTADLPNVEVCQISGRDLAGFPDQAFDLVLAVDSFPYMVAAGGELPSVMIREAARVLKPGGRLVILNFSYRDDLEQDRADVQFAAPRAGLELLRIGAGDFGRWDAVTFDFRKI